MSNLGSCHYCPTEFQILIDSDTLSDSSNCLKPSVWALCNRRLRYQPVRNKVIEAKDLSGSKACDLIAIIDEDDTDAAEIRYVDLEKGNEAPAKGSYNTSTNRAVAESQSS